MKKSLLTDGWILGGAIAFTWILLWGRKEYGIDELTEIVPGVKFLLKILAAFVVYTFIGFNLLIMQNFKK